MGNVTAVTDPRGIRTKYVVNALNQVVQTTNATSRNTQYATRYWYDANDNLVRTDVENVQPDLDANFHPTGTHSRSAANPWLTSTFVYDLLDNLLQRRDEVDATTWAVTKYRYDPLEHPVSITYPRGNRQTFSYDERGQVTGTTRGAGSPLASTVHYAYNANGKLVRGTDGEGNKSDLFYDGFDRQVAQVDMLGNISRRTLDSNGNIVETKVLDGQDGRNPGRQFNAAAAVLLSRTQYRHDNRNRRYLTRRRYFSANVGTGVITLITTDRNHDGWVDTASKWDRNGNLVAWTDDNGHVTTYAYDGLGRLTTETDALGNATTYRYDGNSNLVQSVASERQPEGLTATKTYTSTYNYDAVNRVMGKIDPLGNRWRYRYDSRHNLILSIDAKGNTSVQRYDGLNRRTASISHLRAGSLGTGAVTGQVVTRYAYDANGNVTSLTDPNSHSTTYAYDALDRLQRTTYADGTSSVFTYDRAGNLVGQTDPNGNNIRHTYDKLRRRVATAVTPGPRVVGTTRQTFAYDELSRLVAATDNNSPARPADDSALSFTYDSLGNRRRATQDGKTVTSNYDGLGNRLRLVYPGGTTLTTTYDALNRVKIIREGGSQLARYDYIGPDRVLRRTNGNGTYVEYSYDGARRLTAISYRLSNDHTLLSGFQYSYDQVGNILTEVAQPGDLHTTFRYNSLYRLIRYQRPGLTQTFGYDAAGNRTRDTRNGHVTLYQANAMNRYTNIGGVKQHHDANGNLTWDGSRFYAYGAFDRFRYDCSARRLHFPVVLYRGNQQAVTTDVSATAVTAAEISGVSAPLALSTAHSYDALGRRVRKQAGSETKRYLYDGNRVIEERDGSDTVVARYIARLLMEQDGVRSFYQRDAQSSVRALANAHGTVVERVDYEAFGEPVFKTFQVSETWKVCGNPYLWRGLRYDAGDGLYVLGGRRYAPQRGRGLQP